MFFVYIYKYVGFRSKWIFSKGFEGFVFILGKVYGFL